MRRRGDRYLPIQCSKSTALQLVKDAFTERRFVLGKHLAEETLERGYALRSVEKILICVMVTAASDGKPPEYVDRLWDEAVRVLPRKYYDDVADMLIHLADIFRRQGDRERTWNALEAAKPYVTPGARQHMYDKARAAYTELTQPPRVATIVDILS